jgi:hypothetical protein
MGCAGAAAPEMRNPRTAPRYCFPGRARPLSAQEGGFRRGRSVGGRIGACARARPLRKDMQGQSSRFQCCAQSAGWCERKSSGAICRPKSDGTDLASPPNSGEGAAARCRPKLMAALCHQLHLPDRFENTSEIRLWIKAHSSIRVQEGQPTFPSACRAPASNPVDRATPGNPLNTHRLAVSMVPLRERRAAVIQRHAANLCGPPANGDTLSLPHSFRSIAVYSGKIGAPALMKLVTTSPLEHYDIAASWPRKPPFTS